MEKVQNLFCDGRNPTGVIKSILMWLAVASLIAGVVFCSVGGSQFNDEEVLNHLKEGNIPWQRAVTSAGGLSLVAAPCFGLAAFLDDDLQKSVDATHLGLR